MDVMIQAARHKVWPYRLSDHAGEYWSSQPELIMNKVARRHVILSKPKDDISDVRGPKAGPHE
jgi:hypothetical protein